MWERWKCRCLSDFHDAQPRKATGALKEVPNRITDEGIVLLV